MDDILTLLAKKFSAPSKPQARKLVKRYQIVYSGRASRKFYTYATVRKLVARALHMGLDCYYSPIMVRV